MQMWNEKIRGRRQSKYKHEEQEKTQPPKFPTLLYMCSCPTQFPSTSHPQAPTLGSTHYHPKQKLLSQETGLRISANPMQITILATTTSPDQTPSIKSVDITL